MSDPSEKYEELKGLMGQVEGTFGLRHREPIGGFLPPGARYRGPEPEQVEHSEVVVVFRTRQDGFQEILARHPVEDYVGPRPGKALHIEEPPGYVERLPEKRRAPMLSHLLSDPMLARSVKRSSMRLRALLDRDKAGVEGRMARFVLDQIEGRSPRPL